MNELMNLEKKQSWIEGNMNGIRNNKRRINAMEARSDQG